MAIGARVGVVGAGDTAMDCARTARRLGASSVALVYRRTVDQMPADPEEIHAIREEGVEIVELARPVGLRVEDGALAGLACVRTEYRGDRDAAGRKVPHDVAGSAFEIGLDTLVLAISQHAVPAEVEDSRRQIESIKTELEILDRETAVGVEHTDRRKKAEEQLAKSDEGLVLIKKVRVKLMEEARSLLKALVEDVTGCSMKSLHTDISTVTGERIIIFTMDRNVENLFLKK